MPLGAFQFILICASFLKTGNKKLIDSALFVIIHRVRQAVPAVKRAHHAYAQGIRCPQHEKDAFVAADFHHVRPEYFIGTVRNPRTEFSDRLRISRRQQGIRVSFLFPVDNKAVTGSFFPGQNHGKVSRFIFFRHRMLPSGKHILQEDFLCPREKALVQDASANRTGSHQAPGISLFPVRKRFDTGPVHELISFICCHVPLSP